MLGEYDILDRVLKAIDFKGGESTASSLKVALMLDDKIIQDGLESGVLLELIEKEDDSFYTTKLAEKYLTESVQNQKMDLGKQILRIESYRDIIFRTKMAPQHQLAMPEVTKAFYILLPNIREEIRKHIIAAFLNFALKTNIIEHTMATGNPGIRATPYGIKLFDEIMAEIKTRRRGGKKVSAASPSIQSDLACPECSKPILADYAWCPYCSIELKRNCKNCGKELQPGWKMCPFCASPQ